MKVGKRYTLLIKEAKVSKAKTQDHLSVFTYNHKCALPPQAQEAFLNIKKKKKANQPPKAHPQSFAIKMFTIPITYLHKFI